MRCPSRLYFAVARPTDTAAATFAKLVFVQRKDQCVGKE